jgi:hypothetical protein
MIPITLDVSDENNMHVEDTLIKDETGTLPGSKTWLKDHAE